MREGSSGEVVEVVEGIACFIENLRPLESQFIGLPEQIDDLSQATLAFAIRQPLIEKHIGYPT